MSVDSTGNIVMADDAQLMRLVARGRDDALAALIDRWRPRVWMFIDRMCGWLGRTDDIHQDVWTRIYLYRKKYDPRRPFRSYLFSVAINRCRTAMSKYDLRPMVSLGHSGGLTPDPPSGEPGPIDALIDREQHRRVRQAVDRLPRMQRTVVLLYLLYDSDYRLIADILRLRVGTVRSHMSHALQNLRGRLKRNRISPAAESLPERQVSYE